MLKNFASIFKSPVVIRAINQASVPSIKKTFNKEDEKEKKTKYTTGSTSSNSMILLGSFALLMQKYKEAKCFFGKKTAKDSIENSIDCSQYPANNPIEDRYAYAKLTTVDGFAAGVFDGHGGWQVCILNSRICV